MEIIKEQVFVQTPCDTQKRGVRDLMAVYIFRPDVKEKVPAIFVANPYMLGCNEDWYKTYDVNKELIAYNTQTNSLHDITYTGNDCTAIPSERIFLGTAKKAPKMDDNVTLETMNDFYFTLMEKGYALVCSGGLGTSRSDGYVQTGSHNEISAFASVIDWLNNRCTAFTNKKDCIKITADWCTGNVAMTGKSYVGTTCIGVAATGIQGLKTIIPEAAISNFYDYYRQNGLCVPALEYQGDEIDVLSHYCYSKRKEEPDCEHFFSSTNENMSIPMDRDSGNYNKFWDERNYLKNAQNINIPVLLVHGLNDWNVKTNQCLPLYKKLSQQGNVCKIILHQGEHIKINMLKSINYNDIFIDWIDYWLKGKQNNICESLDNVCVQSNLNPQEWVKTPCWPHERAKTTQFYFNGNELSTTANKNNAKTATFINDLQALGYDYEKDTQAEWLDGLIKDSIMPQSKNCVAAYGNPLKDTIRIAGEVSISFSCTINKPTGILSFMLVDYGKDKRINYKFDDKKDTKFEMQNNNSMYRVITRGHLNAQNRSSLYNKQELTPNKSYTYNIECTPTDYFVKKGNKLGVIIYSADAMQTLRPKSNTSFTLDLNSIKVNITY